VPEGAIITVEIDPEEHYVGFSVRSDDEEDLYS